MIATSPKLSRTNKKPAVAAAAAGAVSDVEQGGNLHGESPIPELGSAFEGALCVTFDEEPRPGATKVSWSIRYC